MVFKEHHALIFLLLQAGALLAIGLVNSGVQNESDPALALLSEYVSSDNTTLQGAAILGLGYAYAGSAKAQVLDLLLPLVSDTNVPIDIASMASLALGMVFVGSCNGDIVSAVLQSMMEYPETAMKDSWTRFFGLGLALLFLGKQEAAEATIETIKVIEHPIAKPVEVLVEICAYASK